MMKVAFLDRDGTINKDYPDEQWRYVQEPELLEGSIEGMQGILELGYQIIIITNQYIINDGIITLDDYYAFTNKLLTKLKKNHIEILDIFFCPHNDKDHCNCKKPKPGLILQALEKYDIDLASSFYCGDSESDYLLAQYFHLPFYGIHFQGNNSTIAVQSLKEVCEYLR
ncbi:MAG: HAD-IIIA family hydrolase [Erysipelotrichaceae bacterium]|nr:HAD-IIIA family hydrolase [Erysipelotrichaceae bacterium]